MSRALLGQGVQVLIAATDADGPGRLPVPLWRPSWYHGVPTIFFQREWHDSFEYSRPYARWLRRYVGEFDVVHIQLVFSYPCLVAAVACQRCGVPYVICPQGSLDPWSLRQKPLRKQVLWHLCVKRMLEEAAAIHYATAEERRRTEHSLGLGRGAVVPLALDEDVIQAAASMREFRDRSPGPGPAPYVLVLCRLHPKKGLELLLDVFLQVTSSAEFRSWRLLVAGDGEPAYVASLRRRVADQHGAERVIFTGWLQDHERAAALREAALFALISHQENFGLAVAEALACGVPVVVSEDVNLAPEIRAAEAGWIVAREQVALTATLRDALRRADERARRGAAGKALAFSQFSPAVVGPKLVELYESVTGAPGSAWRGDQAVVRGA
jgi:glycosyltransferase involved in cell wall biosynthesis